MENIKTEKETQVSTGVDSNKNLSIADELFKLAKLKEQGIITETEFLKMNPKIVSKYEFKLNFSASKI
jgi:hypothetical protein